MEVIYLCDRKRCKECSPLCKHTNDITHAVNFKKDGDDYFENSSTEVLLEEIAALKSLNRRQLEVEKKYHELLKEMMYNGGGENFREQNKEVSQKERLLGSKNVE